MIPEQLRPGSARQGLESSQGDSESSLPDAVKTDAPLCGGEASTMGYQPRNLQVWSRASLGTSYLC